MTLWDPALQTLEGHWQPVKSVVFSGDGRHLASASYDGTVKVWDSAAGQCLLTLEGHSGHVNSVAFSGDGMQLASAADDHTVKVWDSATGQCRKTLNGHRGYVNSVAFSGDGTQLASASDDNTIKAWDSATGQCLWTLKGHRKAVNSVAFSADGTRLGSASSDRTVKVWDSAAGQCLQTLEGHSESVSSVVFLGDGTHLASASYDRTVKVWDSFTGQCLQTLEGHHGPVQSVAFSGDTQLASASQDKTVKVWDGATGQCLQTLEGHRDRVNSVTFSGDGTQLASASHDKTVQVWDSATVQRINKIRITEDVVKAVAGNNESGQDTMALLLDKRGDEIQITEDVVKAAAGNYRSGQKIMALLLDKRGDEIQITEDIIKAAARNKESGQEIMALLLDKRGDEIRITEDVVKAAAGNKLTGKEVMILLLEEREGDIDPKAIGQFKWIQELRTVGCSFREIAELLCESAHDSPWIYFRPARIPYRGVVDNHHLECCAHHLLSHHDNKSATVSRSVLQADDERDVRRSFEELCGLGGISPFSRNPNDWNGTVHFKEQNSVALLSHSLADSSWNCVDDVICRLIRVAENFSTAARTVQDAGFCCDSYTVLRRCNTNASSVSPEIQMVRISFSSAVRILEPLKTLEKLHKGGIDLHPGLVKLKDASRTILSQFFDIQSIPESSTDLPRHSLHLGSLAIQLLCVSFLSYTQAHIGSIRPFFLDSPLKRIVLLGMETSAEVNIHITANLVELTCLAGMAQGPVFVFDVLSSQHKPPARQSTEKFDVRASLENVLDTWGPGQLIFQPKQAKAPVAIRIGGGYICIEPSYERSGKYHWDHKPKWSDESRLLDLGNEIVIGSLVEVNTSCNKDEDQCWKESMTECYELGTYRPYGEMIERQAGVQLGLDKVAITVLGVWAKRPGMTIKAKIIESDNSRLICRLSEYLGVRVSFCTGVAQRVPLRVLVAELLPAFVGTLIDRTEYEGLETNSRMTETFRDMRSDLESWLESLSLESKPLVYGWVRLILETLKDTGMSPDGTYFSVAWPRSGVVEQCFRIPLEGYNKWTTILADSDDCATFAYISNACLEYGALTCGGTRPIWKNEVRMLETAVLCRSGLKGGTLLHEQTYCFQKMDNLFWVKAQRDTSNRSIPAALVRLSSIMSLPRDICYRLIEREKNTILREKRFPDARAELVFITATKDS